MDIFTSLALNNANKASFAYKKLMPFSFCNVLFSLPPSLLLSLTPSLLSFSF
jgi:hypothetical protein